MSQVTLDSIISDSTELIQAQLTKLKKEVETVTRQVPNEIKTAIDQCFSKNEIIRPFAGLDSNTTKTSTLKNG